MEKIRRIVSVVSVLDSSLPLKIFSISSTPSLTPRESITLASSIRLVLNKTKPYKGAGEF